MDTFKLGLTQLSQLPALPILDDTDIGGPPALQRTFSQGSSSVINPLLSEMRRPVVSEDCMRDPINDTFFLDTWHQVAENNTKLFRQVFRCMPDNEVRTWKEYQEYAAFAERFTKSQGGDKSQIHKQQDAPGATGPPGTGLTSRFTTTAGTVGKQVGALGEKLTEKMTNNSDRVNGENVHGTTHHSSLGGVEQWANDQEKRVQSQSPPPPATRGGLHVDTASGSTLNEKLAPEPADDAVVSPMNPAPPEKTFTFPAPPPIPNETAHTDFASHSQNPPPTSHSTRERSQRVTISEPLVHPNAFPQNQNSNSTPNRTNTKRSRRRATTKSSNKQFNATDADIMLDKEDAKHLLELVQGHIVLWPYDWLESEERGGGWLYNVDQIAPLEI
jgi:phospholipase D1/2